LAAFLGLATDLKTVPKSMIRERVLRTGDGSHKYSKDADEADIEANNNQTVTTTEHFWGWGDKEMTEADLKGVEILYKEED
jgi:stearoyl-CoA desaturase (delta-9 desaturase)